MKVIVGTELNIH